MEGVGVRLRGYGVVLAFDGAATGGNGRSRCLLSRGFLRLALLSSSSALWGRSPLSCARWSLLSMAPFKISLGVDVKEEGLNFCGNGDAVEEEAEGRVSAP